ncbi:hypothetical protein SAMN04487939_104246 [Lysobacter sp. yr284]|nr:hypothetical protein SAMN04487939_104246 [Lysobacter sp. yr284]
MASGNCGGRVVNADENYHVLRPGLNIHREEGRLLVEHLIYHPPKSVAFGHRPRVRDIGKSWQMTQAYLQKHASGKYRSTEPIRLACFGSDWATLDLLERKFGKPANFHPAAAFAQLQDWTLDSTAISDLVDIYFAVLGLSRDDGTHLDFSICFDFKWNGCEESALEGSYLGITFDQLGIFFQPSLTFPFSWDSLPRRRWLNSMLRDSPFRFREQYFQRAIPTKAGKRYRTLKLQKGWLSEL